MLENIHRINSMRLKKLSLVFFLSFVISLEAKLPKTVYGIYPTTYFQFWFLYEKETTNGQTQVIFRPFFSNYKEKFSSHELTTSIYPLYYKERTMYWSRSTLLLFFTQDSTKHEDTGDDTDLNLSLLFLKGDGGVERDRYYGFFPFYGSFRSRLGWDEIYFFMFPIYTSWRYKDFKARSVLWPLTVYGSSETRSEFRIFPFYTRKSHIGKYERYNILWPFISFGKDFLDKKEPVSFSFFWLLFAHKKSLYGNMRSYSIFPILGSMSLASYGYDDRKAETNFSLFFFLYQYSYSNDKDMRKHIFFPFYGYSRFASKEFRFITPFYLHSNSDTYGVRSNSYYLFPPIFHYSKEEFIKEERTEVYYKFWPFFKWHKDSEGTITTNMFSLFPVRSDVFELVWDPIWSIFEYKKSVNGETKISALFRLYTQRTAKNEFHFYVPLILDFSNTEDYHEWNILYGLIGRRKTLEESKIKLLWFIEI
ncbi:MAG: hypothetical protein SFU98_03160 [Leptospiraceae bacterium]|nr:hypothetical protein [Leptospiraceae bacterium]